MTVPTLPTGPRPLPVVVLCGVRLHAITEGQCVAHIADCLEVGRGGWVVTANLDHLRRLVRDTTYAHLCRDATVMVADGMPLIWASRIQGTPLPERVAGSDVISSLSAEAVRRGRSVYLLGGDEGTAEAAALALQQRFAGLKVAGTECPPIGFDNCPDYLTQIEHRLRHARPDIVYVALGSPKQEQLMSRFRELLPGAWWLGVGVSFSFLCGHVRRAPGWVQRAGLEWLHRLGQEPRRLAGRYLVHGIPFCASLLAGAALHRVADAFRKVCFRRGARGTE